MMVQALAKGRDELDPATVQAVQEATLSALHDPDKGVRIVTVMSPGHLRPEGERGLYARFRRSA